MKSFIKSMFDFQDFEKVADEAKSYQLPPAIGNKFNLDSYNEQTGCFELNIGNSVGAAYELDVFSTEGQPESYLSSISHTIQQIIADVFPQYFDYESPWVMQVFLSDDFNVKGVGDDFERYISEEHRASELSQHAIKMYRNNIDYFSQEGGVFEDALSNTRFRARRRRTRVVIYRRLGPKANMSHGLSPEGDLNVVCASFEKALNNSRIGFKRYDEEALHVWMKKWLSPKPAGFKSCDEYLEHCPLPKGEDRPITFDLVSDFFNECPKSDNDKGVWYLDNLPHKFIPIVGIKSIPEEGHLTAERKRSFSDQPEEIQYYGIFDKLPEGSVFVMSIVMQSQDQRLKALEQHQKKAEKSGNIEALNAGEDAQIAMQLISEGNCFFPVSMGVYIKGNTLKELDDLEYGVLSTLSMNKFKPLTTRTDLVKLDSFLRFLPFNYSYDHDKKYLHRSRLLSLRQIGALFPIYGRGRGTEKFVLSGMNRVGEHFGVDPLKDKLNSSHLFLLGTTGSGKSALLCKMIIEMMAVHRPHMVILDAGASMRIAMDYLEGLGVKVNRIEIKMVDKKMPSFSLNPFAKTKAMIAQCEQIERIHSMSNYIDVMEKKIDSIDKIDGSSDLIDEYDVDNRDYLLEFVSSAALMISSTASSAVKAESLSQQDYFLLIEALKKAAKDALSKGHVDMIPSDLSDGMVALAKAYEKEGTDTSRSNARRLLSMSQGLRSFIETSLNALYFNRRAKPLPEADITWFELGLWKDDKPELEASRALAFITLLNNTMSESEARRKKGRPTIFVGDECHIVTKKPITAASVVQNLKMSRKNGLTFILCTQSPSDIPKESRQIIAMMEFMVILWSSKEERQKISEAVELSEEKMAMVHSLRKIPGKYIEGLVLSKTVNALFRNMPPREYLSLSMTDLDENTWRQQLQDKYNCTELEACFLMGQKLKGEEYSLDAVRELLS